MPLKIREALEGSNISILNKRFKQMKYLFLCIGIIMSMYLQGQNSISGKILDKDLPLIGATVVIIAQADSTMISFGITNDDGLFKIYDVPVGNYLAQLSYTGYTNHFIPVEVENQGKIELGNIQLIPYTEVLREVEISAERIPMGILGDTISYNAAAFQTKEGATVEDLLKKLPGIDVERDGSIKAYGEDVDKVLVDGKEFFNGDPTMATKNLEAEAVDKIQVFEKKSDEAEFTGVDDGEEQKTINIALKEDHKNGGFGRITAEGGTENRYKGKINYNRFSPSSQSSVIANSNNMNQQVFSFGDYIDFMGGLNNVFNGAGLNAGGILSMSPQDQQGIDEANAVGLNFNYFRFKNINWSSNYMFINNTNTLLSQSESDFFGLSAPYSSKDSTSSLSILNNHRINSKLDYSINPLNKLIFKISGAFRANKNDQYGQASYRQNDEIFNIINNDLLTIGSQFEGEGKFSYIKKFEKKGRNFRLNSNYKRTLALEENQLFNSFNQIDNFRLINQNQSYLNTENTTGVSVKHMEPIAKKSFISGTISTSINQQLPNRDFFDIVNDQMILNEDFSAAFERKWMNSTAGILFQRNRKKLKLFAGIDYTRANLSAGKLSETNQVKTNKNYILSNFKIIKYFKGSRKLETTYSSNIQSPSLRQLITIPNNLNPNVINLGNSSLAPEYIHNFRLNYSDLNEFNFSNFFSSFNFQYSDNKIVFERDILPDFTSVSKAFQSPEYYNINGYMSYGSPIRKLKIKYDISTQFNYQHYETRLNQKSNTISASSGNIDLRIENRNKEKWDVALGVNSNISYFDNSADNQLNQTFITNSYYFDGLYNFKETWEVGFIYDLRSIVGQTLGEPQGESLLLHLLNIEINKTFRKNPFTISARIHDLFNQNTGIFRNGDANVVTLSNYNTLGRYVTLGLSYKIGKKKESTLSF